MRITHSTEFLQTNQTRRQLLLGAGTSVLGLTPFISQADTWPTKPLRLIVPFAPGGSSEIVARALAGEMSKTIGQSVFVENKQIGRAHV